MAGQYNLGTAYCLSAKNHWIKRTMKLFYSPLCYILLIHTIIATQSDFKEYVLKPVSFGVAFGVGAYASYAFLKSYTNYKNELNNAKATLSTIESKIQTILEKKEAVGSENSSAPDDSRKKILTLLNQKRFEPSSLYISGTITCLLYVNTNTRESEISSDIECSYDNSMLKLTNKSTEKTAMIWLSKLPSKIYLDSGARVTTEVKQDKYPSNSHWVVDNAYLSIYFKRDTKDFSNAFISLTNKAKLLCDSDSSIRLRDVIAIVKDSTLEATREIDFSGIYGFTNNQTSINIHGTRTIKGI